MTGWSAETALKSTSKHRQPQRVTATRLWPHSLGLLLLCETFRRVLTGPFLNEMMVQLKLHQPMGLLIAEKAGSEDGRTKQLRSRAPWPAPCPRYKGAGVRLWDMS